MINEWREIAPGQVWTSSNFFPDNLIEQTLAEMDSAVTTELRPDDSIRDKFRRTGANPTLYSYQVHQLPIREDKIRAQYVMQKIGRLTQSLGYPDPCRTHYNPLQLFAKSFTANSYYELHTEPPSLYGEFAFLIFLNDVDQGSELVFPSRADTEVFLQKHPEQREVWEENVRLLQKEGREVEYLLSVKIQPRRNLAVAFRVGSAHYVEPAPNRQGTFRATIAGWPYATERLIRGLDENCKISHYFEPEAPPNRRINQ